jgi:hypothetical protein
MNYMPKTVKKASAAKAAPRKASKTAPRKPAKAAPKKVAAKTTFCIPGKGNSRKCITTNIDGKTAEKVYQLFTEDPDALVEVCKIVAETESLARRAPKKTSARKAAKPKPKKGRSNRCSSGSCSL